MAGVIDTNLLLYAANADAEEHKATASFLTEAGTSPGQWYLTEGILYEFLRVSTHPKVFPRSLRWQESLAFLAPFLESPRFAILGRSEQHFAILEDVLSDLTHPAGNLFFDIRTVALMRENGIRHIYTTDTDFLQFRGISVINPLKP